MAGKHTPAPWAVLNVRDGECLIGFGIDNLEGAFSKPAPWYTGWYRIDEPDARLIAAAPDLLDQHEADMEDLTLLLHAINEGDPKAELVMRVEDMKRRKRAAIARATQPLPPPNEE